MYGQYYNPQMAVDRINNQIAELEKLKNQIPQQQQAPTSLTQNFQITPSNSSVMKYANSIEEVNKEFVIGDTPYFSKDMSVVWIKNAKGEVKSYELREIIKKDEKDLQIELLTAQIEDLKRGMKKYAESIRDDVDESVESNESTSISDDKQSKRKSK